MHKKKKLSKEEQHLNYIAFLKKRLDSDNYKKNVSKEEYKKTEEKYKKAKLISKLLYNN